MRCKGRRGCCVLLTVLVSLIRCSRHDLTETGGRKADREMEEAWVRAAVLHVRHKPEELQLRGRVNLSGSAIRAGAGGE